MKKNETGNKSKKRSGAFLLPFFLLQKHRKSGESDGSQTHFGLIKSPELWVVHGKKYVPRPEPPEGVAAMLSKVAENAKETEKTASAALSAIKTQQQNSGTQTPETTPDRTYTAKQLKELGLLTRYFNMFDFVYSTFGRKWFKSIFRQQREEWKAWKNYMRDFFDGNEAAKTAWEDFSKLGIYAESFRKFLNKEVIGKKPEQLKTWRPSRNPCSNRFQR